MNVDQLIDIGSNVLAAIAILIIGWVAMWRPLEILLYEWWPVLSDARLYARLAALPVEVRPRESSGLFDGQPGAAR